MAFLTVDPFIGISVFIAKLSERQYCWRVFEDFHSQEFIQFFWRTTVASSCVCTSPLAVMTIVGLQRFRQGIHISITQVLFADHLHWRTRVNNKFSFLKFKSSMQAGTYFPKVRRMLLFLAPSILIHFLASFPRCFAGTFALATLSPPGDRSLKFGSVGGCADEVTPWANVSDDEGFWSRILGVTRNSLREFHTLDWLRHVLCTSGE